MRRLFFSAALYAYPILASTLGIDGVAWLTLGKTPDALINATPRGLTLVSRGVNTYLLLSVNYEFSSQPSRASRVYRIPLSELSFDFYQRDRDLSRHEYLELPKSFKHISSLSYDESDHRVHAIDSTSSSMLSFVYTDDPFSTRISRPLSVHKAPVSKPSGAERFYVGQSSYLAISRLPVPTQWDGSYDERTRVYRWDSDQNFELVTSWPNQLSKSIKILKVFNQAENESQLIVAEVTRLRLADTQQGKGVGHHVIQLYDLSALLKNKTKREAYIATLDTPKGVSFVGDIAFDPAHEKIYLTDASTRRLFVGSLTYSEGVVSFELIRPDHQRIKRSFEHAVSRQNLFKTVIPELVLDHDAGVYSLRYTMVNGKANSANFFIRRSGVNSSTQVVYRFNSAASGNPSFFK